MIRVCSEMFACKVNEGVVIWCERCVKQIVERDQQINKIIRSSAGCWVISVEGNKSSKK